MVPFVKRKYDSGAGEKVCLEERIRLQHTPGQMERFSCDDQLAVPEPRNSLNGPSLGESGVGHRDRVTLEEVETGERPDKAQENEAVSRVIERMKREFGERIKTERADSQFKTELWAAIEDALKDEGRAVPTIEMRQTLTERIYYLITGLGPLELLFQRGYSEIMVTRFDSIYYEEKGKMQKSEVKFESEKELRTVLERIVSPIGRTIDDMSPMVDGRLEDGSRFNAVIPPISIDGSQLTIRRFPETDLKEEDYLAFGSMDEKILAFLKMAVRARLNLIVSGGTGSGKTSLLNLLGNFLSFDPGLAVITIEDSAELRIRHPNVRRYETRAATAEGKGEVTSRMLVKNAMRVRPDIIIIGEIRDGTMADFFRAASSGHDGCMTTVHNNSPEELESTVQILFQMAEDYNFSESAIRRLYANAVDIIIQIKRYPDHARRISNISHVVGYGKRAAGRLGILPGDADFNADEVYLREIFRWEKTGVGQDGKFTGHFSPSGYIPRSILEKAAMYGVDIDEKIFREEEAYDIINHYGSDSLYPFSGQPDSVLTQTRPH